MMKKSFVALVLGLVAAVLYFSSLADYAFPGESAALLASWQGLAPATNASYPLFGAFARLFGGGNLIAPIAGVFAVVALFVLVRFFVSLLCDGDETREKAGTLGTVSGIVTALVFMLTPCVREAATHADARLFDASWALFIFLFFIPYLSSAIPGALFALLIGALAAVGLCDSPLFLALLPLLVISIVFVEIRRGAKPYLSLTVFACAFVVALLVGLKVFGLELTPFLRATARGLKFYARVPGWILVALVATCPFLVSLVAAARTLRGKTSLALFVLHLALLLSVILAVATPLSPSSLMAPYGLSPVATSAFVAMTAGYLASFLLLARVTPVGLAVGVASSFVILFALAWNLFTFDAQRGAFADRLADKILDDMGDRTWFVSDGLLDDHLLLRAKARHQELNLVSLARDLEPDYLESLRARVIEKGIGGTRNGDLALSLTLGVLPFVQDFLALDPDAAKKVVIFGASDLWYAAGKTSVPEFLFFGGDETRVPDWSQWKAFDTILAAPKRWGSYRVDEDLSAVDRLKFALRRHMGLVANNRGVYLQDLGRADEAFALYELVLNEIDHDNVSALFNEVEMAGQNYEKAISKKRELDRRLKTILDDKARRYVLWRLSAVYGYIRNPDIFVRLGITWARSGRPKAALAQIRRAADIVPGERRLSYLNMMAELYAAENDKAASRKIYEQILAKDAKNREALMGMMRIKLSDGDEAAARGYLERAASLLPEASRQAAIDRAMLALMENDLVSARKTLEEMTSANAKDLQAWSLLASVVLQEFDQEKDAKKKAALLADVKERIIPAMELQAESPLDFFVQSTKAFMLLRAGEESRRDARDALALAAKARPNVEATQDLVLELDISLADQENAESHARDVLRRNRNAPLANYVMGSLAVGRGAYGEAEAFLRRAVDSPRANILAYNDLAEVLRRTNRAAEAEALVRTALEKAPNFYILHQTLGEILIEEKKNLEEAEASILKSIDLSKSANGEAADARPFIALARVQEMRGDKKAARLSLRRVERALKSLSDFERREYEEIRKRVQ